MTDELCIDRPWHANDVVACVDPVDVVSAEQLEEGDCFRGRFAGESAELLEVIEVVDCPTSSGDVDPGAGDTPGTGTPGGADCGQQLAGLSLPAGYSLGEVVTVDEMGATATVTAQESGSVRPVAIEIICANGDASSLVDVPTEEDLVGLDELPRAGTGLPEAAQVYKVTSGKVVVVLTESAAVWSFVFEGPVESVVPVVSAVHSA
jgi:hypothetical protein